MRSGIKLDHKRILEETACLLDTFRLREDQLDLDDGNLSALKQRLHSARSLEELVVILGSIPEALQAMARVVEEHCLHNGRKRGVLSSESVAKLYKAQLFLRGCQVRPS